MTNDIYYKIYGFGPKGWEKLGTTYIEEEINPYVNGLNPDIFFEALVVEHTISLNKDIPYNHYYLFEEKRKEEMGLRREKK